MKQTSVIALFLLLGLSLASPYGWTRQEVDNAEKLDYLNRATGGSSAGASSTFQARLDAIMDVTPSAERSYVSTEDAQIRAQVASSAKEEALVEAKRAEELNPERYNPKKLSDKTKVTDASLAAGLKTDGTEKGYLKAREEIQKEFDTRLQKETAPETSGATSTAAGIRPADRISEALNNNPFYGRKSKGADGENAYENKKKLLYSRVSALTGDDPEIAKGIVNEATSTEDLILLLMKKYGLTYGEVSNAVS